MNGRNRNRSGKLASALAACMAGLALNSSPAQDINLQSHSIESAGGDVYAVIEAGGHLYMAGGFTLVNGAHQRLLCRLNSDGSLDSDWNVQIENGPVTDLAADADSIYLGGNFTTVNGTAQPYLAKVSMADGSLDSSFTITPDAPVTALMRDNDNLYVGGNFTNIASSLRRGFARISTDGVLDGGFMCMVGGQGAISCLAMSGTDIIAGGTFTNIGGQARRKLAKISSGGIVSGTFTNGLYGGAFHYISSLAVDGPDLFVGGFFTNIGGHARTGLAKMDIDGTVNTTFTNLPDSAVSSLSADDQSLYIGGFFNRVSGLPRAGIARLSKIDGEPHGLFTNGIVEVTTYTPPMGWVNTLLLSGDNLYVGGLFLGVGDRLSPGIARVNAASSAPDTSFNARATIPGEVCAFARQPDGKLLVGGFFDLADGSRRQCLARFNADGSPDTGWNPGANHYVTALAADSSGVYAGGDFWEIAGVARDCMAKLSLDTGALISEFNPAPDWSVNALALDGAGGIYAGGDFTTIGGAPANCLAKLSTETGLANASFTNGPSSSVNALLLDGGGLYAGGHFTSVGDQERRRLARLNPTTGAPDPAFVCNASNDVLCMAISGTDLYVGGSFTNIGGVVRHMLAKVNATNGAVDAAFAPDANDDVNALAIYGDKIFAGGSFSNIAGAARTGLAAVNAVDGALDAGLTNSTDGSVNALLLTGNRLCVGGRFTHLDGIVSPCFAIFSFTPPAPHALPATDIGLSSFNANWESAAGATNYSLDVATSSAFTTFISGYNNRRMGDALTCAVTGLNAAATHYYRVRAQHDGGTSSNSATISATTLTPATAPSTPTGVQASDGTYTNRVRVAWNAAAGAYGYTVWRNTSDNSGSAAQIGSSTMSPYDDTTAATGTLYYYWARATNHLGSSAFSASDMGYRASAAGEPGLPTCVSASDGAYANRVQVAWTAGSGATGYEIYRSRVGDSTAPARIGTTASTSYSDTSARRNVRYAYWVRATNSAGASPHSIPDTGWRRGLPASYSGGVSSDFAVFDSNTGRWYIMAGDGTLVAWAFEWGWPGAWPVPGDYNGDGISDLAVFDQNTGCWYITTLDGTVLAWAFSWGWPGAWPVSGDYDGDAVSDCAVFDQNTGWWYVAALTSVQSSVSSLQNPSSPNTDNPTPNTSSPAHVSPNTEHCTLNTGAPRVLAWSFPWGWPGAWPVPGDYNGDGRSDCTVFDQNTGWWYSIALDETLIAWAFQWGWPGAWPVSGDYDGDGISDCAVFDQNTGGWYVIKLDGTVLAWAFAWGWPGAWPVSGDYDGDGISDLAVFDQNTGWWYVIKLDGTVLAWAFAWGWPGAIPVPGAAW